MPFSTRHEVHNCFFNEFISGATLKKQPLSTATQPYITVGGFETLVRYYNSGGHEGVQDSLIICPSIVIQDFTPTIDKTITFGYDAIEGYYDEITSTRELIPFPVFFKFKYQVTTLAKTSAEKEALDMYMDNRFASSSPAFFEFNKLMAGEERYVADIVPYKVTGSDIPRSDGYFQSALDFELTTFVHARAKNPTLIKQTGTENTKFEGGNFEEALSSFRLVLHSRSSSDITKLLEQHYNY